MQEKGLSERRALRALRMSASALQYVPRPDRNQALREQIVTLAQRHRRYGAGMIYLKLRQAGQAVNHKRVERLYTLEKLQVRRRRRKKIPVADRVSRWCARAQPMKFGPWISSLTGLPTAARSNA